MCVCVWKLHTVKLQVVGWKKGPLPPHWSTGRRTRGPAESWSSGPSLKKPTLCVVTYSVAESEFLKVTFGGATNPNLVLMEEDIFRVFFSFNLKEGKPFKFNFTPLIFLLLF